MTGKHSISSLLLSCIVYGFFFLEWFRPTSSLTVFILMLVFSLISLLYAIFGHEKKRDTFSLFAVVIAITASGLMMTLFFVMLIMGMGP